jgi:hypothetical protein
VEKSKPKATDGGGSKRGDAPEWVKLAGLVPDARNANKGTARGAAMIAGSLEKYGAGRSILCDVIVSRWELATGKKAVLL